MKKTVTYSSRSATSFVIIAISILIVVSSCSVQKRLYRPGYSVNWKNREKLSDFQTNNQPIDSKTVSTQVNASTVESQVELRASLQPSIEPIKKATQELIDSNEPEDSTDCDIIILENGTELSVKIKEIGTEEITYTQCESDTNTILSVKIEDVSQVKINKNSVESNSRPQTKEHASPKIESFAIASLVCSILPFIVPLGGLLGIIFGVISLNRIRNFPDKHKGKGIAIAGLILGILQLLLVASFILLLIYIL